jgi:hypothetical protein
MTAETWASLGTWLTGIATLAMAVAVIWTVKYARDTLEANKQDSRERTRPVMVADLRPELLSHGTTLMVIKNYGASPASEVKLTFDRDMPENLDDLPDSDNWKWIFQRYQFPVHTWAPGWARTNVVRFGGDDLEPITVTISYLGRDAHVYEETYLLEPAHVMKETAASPSDSDIATKAEKYKVKALHALVRTVRGY